jgi:amino acid adenylation domain-containing protein/non-ribosomal peptide synthase protein (TIGR01720 family)
VGADVTAYSGAPGHAPAVPIGQPLPNTQVYLLDQQLEPVPVGVVGEIFVGGPGLARAYLGQAGNTALRFVANPFGPPGSRLYRTGDLARYQPDGTLLFAGRADQQLKIRGVRVEPGEVEAALRAQAGVAEAVVVAHGEDELHRQLVAYVVGDPDLDVEALRVQLRRLLPEALVPGFILVLPELPRTSTGKLDRKRLPSPQQRERIQHYVPPATVTEALLAEIWADVLHLARVSTEDNFFELGGHSLLATQVVARVRERCGVELPLRVLFNTTATLREVAAEVDRTSREAQGLAVPPLTRREHGRTAPLSFNQERFWFLEQLGSLNGAYHEFYALQIHGPLNIAALESSLNQMIRRHETLRTHIENTADGQGMQVISEPQPLSLDVLDLSALSASEREQQVREVAGEHARAPFVFSHSLFRIRMLRLEPSEHLLLVTIHHIVSDYWSHLVFLRELGAFYAATLEQRPAALPELPVQYADYSLWQREWLQGEALEQQMSYWRTQLAGSPAALQLPTDHPRPSLPSYRGARLFFELNGELYHSLLEFSRSQGVTFYMLLLAAFQLLLSRWSRQEDIVVGSPIAGRRQRETEGLIGFFVNTLVLRTDLSGEPSFNQLLARVRDVALGAYAHQDLPFEKLVAELDPVRDPSRHPVFQVMFILQNQPVDFFQWPGLQLTALGLQRSSSLLYVHGATKFDLLVDCVESPDGLWGRFEYSTDLFELVTMERMMGSFQTLLEVIAAGDGQQCIAELPLLTPQQKHQVLHTWNQTDTSYPRHRHVYDLIAEQAARTPDAPAITSDGLAMSFRELEHRSNQLAHHLQSLGVAPDTLVGLSKERSISTIVALLGIWKAGGAYLPLDSAYPEERLRFIIEDAKISLVLAPRLDNSLTCNGQIKCVPLDTLALSSYPATRPRIASSPDHLAYVLYTSGSTGRPKGVAVSHGSLANYVNHVVRTFDVASGTGSPLHTTLAFDLTVTALMPSLVAGRPVTLLPEGESELPELAAALAQGQDFSLVKLTPSHLNVLQTAYPETAREGAARAFIIGGEALTAAHLALWRKHSPGIRLINEYGPTETVVGCATYQVDDSTTQTGPIPIGKPIANTQLYILDSRLNPVPVGVVGELCIGGDGLSRGYLGRPGLTGQRFVPNPYGPPSSRLYRTGDLARYLSDGNLEFVGRTDDQVKIRGFRIELAEIEQVLHGHESIADCVIVAREDGERKHLVAYVVAREQGATLDTAALREYLATNLPDYMVPALFVQLPQLPVTPNGKIDRRALPAPNTSEHPQELATPRTPVEEALEQIWCEILNLEHVGIHDNFFEIGGDSIAALQIVARAGHEGIKITVKGMIEHQTIAQIATALAEQPDAAAEDPQETIQEEAAATMPADDEAASSEVLELPLLPAQADMIQLVPDGFQRNITIVVFDCMERMEPARLEEALRHVVMQHDALRIQFWRTESGWRQGVAGAGAVRGQTLIENVDMSAPASAEEDRARTFELVQQLNDSIRLDSPPMIRGLLIEFGERRPQYLMLAVHHLVFDAISGRILREDLQAAYEQLTRGEAVRLPQRTTPMAEWARCLTNYARSEEAARDAQYFQSLGWPSCTPLPRDHVESEPAEIRSVLLTLDERDTEAVLKVRRRFGVQMDDLLLASVIEALSLWTGGRRFAINLMHHGRVNLNGHDISRTIGFFSSTIPMLIDISAAQDGASLLTAVTQQVASIPSQGIVCGVLRHMSDNNLLADLPRPEIRLNHLGMMGRVKKMLFRAPTDPRLEEPVEPAMLHSNPVQHREHLIEVTTAVHGRRLYMQWAYSSHIHRLDTIQQTAQHAIDWLTRMAAQSHAAAAK